MFYNNSYATLGIISANRIEAAPSANWNEESPGEAFHPGETSGNLGVEHYPGASKPQEKNKPGV